MIIKEKESHTEGLNKYLFSGESGTFHLVRLMAGSIERPFQGKLHWKFYINYLEIDMKYREKSIIIDAINRHLL